MAAPYEADNEGDLFSATEEELYGEDPYVKDCDALKVERSIRNRMGFIVVLLIAIALVAGALAYQGIVKHQAQLATQGIEININDNKPVFNPADLVLGSGITVSHEFFIQNMSHQMVDYTMSGAHMKGDKDNAVTLTLKDDKGTVLYSGPFNKFDGKTGVAAGTLWPEERKVFTLSLSTPHDTDYDYTPVQLAFDLQVDATEQVQ